MNNEYGSVEYYAEQFADWFADIQASQPHLGNNIVSGFKLALADWKEYYQNQAIECERIEQIFNEEI